MKKTIAVFFILMVLKAVAFAQTSLFPTPAPNSPVPRQPLIATQQNTAPLFPTYPTNNTCIFGNTNIRTYADQLEKLILTEQDSFLAAYKREQEKQLIPSYFRETSFQSFINREQISCAMKRIPYVTQSKKTCASSAENGTYVKQTPCVTDGVVDYIYWGLNEALRCYGDSIDSFERKIIFKKLNHESAFGFFFQYDGGTGIAQLIRGTQKNLFHPGNAGFRFLKKHVTNNPRSCENFKKLLARTTQIKNLKSCEFISMGDGIGRSLLGGIGLYLHYRSDEANPYNAEKLLAYWGYAKTNTDQYRQVRSYITLGMYNKGPGAVLNTIKGSIGKSALRKKSEAEAFNIVMKLVKRSNFYGYVKAVENSTNSIFDRTGSCKI